MGGEQREPVPLCVLNMMERSLIQDLRNCCPVNMDAVTSLLSSDVVKDWTRRTALTTPGTTRWVATSL